MDFVKVHSSTAILIHAMDGTNPGSWHRYHVDNRIDYADGLSDLLSCMGNWRPYNLDHRLAYFAKNFKPRRFVNRNVIAGFYDTNLSDNVEVGASFKPF